MSPVYDPIQDEKGKPLIAGRSVTGLSNLEESLSGMKKQVPFFLQDELVSRGAHYKKAFFPFTSYVVTDDRIITGQNPQSSKEIAEAVVKRLHAMKLWLAGVSRVAGAVKSASSLGTTRWMARSAL